LAATVWSYDLVLKRTAAGPAAMATARALDLLLGAAATSGDTRGALPSALTLGTHTLATTTVSRHETQGGTPVAPLTALAITTALTWTMTHSPRARADDVGPGRGGRVESPGFGSGPVRGPGSRSSRATAEAALRTALAAAYAATSARPLFHAALNPSPPLTQRAVGGGIRAMIPLQAALSARSGALTTALVTAALAPAARKFARKVSVT
jgi:4-hydroxybenzoate polyprenyltransferase